MYISAFPNYVSWLLIIILQSSTFRMTFEALDKCLKFAENFIENDKPPDWFSLEINLTLIRRTALFFLNNTDKYALRSR